jgi:hypothetical protein
MKDMAETEFGLFERYGSLVQGMSKLLTILDFKLLPCVEYCMYSETSANHNLTPGKYPKEYIQTTNKIGSVHMV